jgi:UDP-N-acetylmuramate dehydrogenase
MNLKKSELIKKFGKNIFFQEDLSKYSWFNLGGPANILFKPESIEQLKNFLNYINNSLEITCLGAGSNTLIRDGGFSGVVIKLSPKFSYIKQIEKNILEVGAATLDKNLSRYAAENSIVNFEFLSCIPGSVGGTIKMNSGCYGNEISDILISVQAIDLKGNLMEIKRDKIKFIYRGNNLPDDLIFLSARFHAKNGDGNLINEKIKKYSKEKKDSQPSQIKTCGSTFKNTKNKKAWELIKDSNCNLLSFGKAKISEKHCNFFVNEGGASSEDIEKLINTVRQKVFDKHKIKLDLELKIIGENKKNV